MTSFYFMRHGETDWNLQGITQGQKDVPLNETGLAQVKLAATSFNFKDSNIRTILSSPLKRAKETSLIVSSRTNIPIQYSRELMECCWGEREGTKHGNWFKDWANGISSPVGAESWDEFEARVNIGLKHAHSLPGPVLIVSHKCVWCAIRQLWELKTPIEIENASVLQLF